MKRREDPKPWRMKNADGSDFYNEHGKTFYVFPIRRDAECFETEGHWAFLIANVDDFNEEHRTGDWIAECGNAKEAQALVTALNSHASDQAKIKGLREALEGLHELATRAGWNTPLFTQEFGATVRKARAALKESRP